MEGVVLAPAVARRENGPVPSGAIVSSPGALGLHSPASSSLLLHAGNGGSSPAASLASSANDENEIADADMMPIGRDRCNTWPLRRPANRSPQQPETIMEEDSISDSTEQLTDLASSNAINSTDNGFAAGMSTPPPSGFSRQETPSPGHLSPTGSASGKKGSTRRNAWGSMSYADLITKAILESPEKRLTLAQVYEWMVQNVAYFRDKGDSNSSAGWKVPLASSSPYAALLTPLRACPPSSSACVVRQTPCSPAMPSQQQQQQGAASAVAVVAAATGPQQASSATAPAAPPLQAQAPIQAGSPQHDDDFDEYGPLRARCYTWPMQQFMYDPSLLPRDPSIAAALMPLHLQQQQQQQPPLPPPPQLPLHPQHHPPPKKKRCRKKPSDQLAQKKPNPWGEESYSDLIAKALESAPEGRLKLNEIYQWFSDNIPYFRDRSSQEEAAGWKNSIRHNLSLHSRFMRIQNEGAGKSSWWVINPDAKPGRNPRRTRDRAATADSKTIGTLKENRRKARNRVKDIRSMMGGSVSSSQISVSSHEQFMNDDFPPMYRDRANSTLTNPTSRPSPSMDNFNDFDFPPWIEGNSAGNQMPIPADIVDRTQEIRLECAESPVYRRPPMHNGINGEPKDIKPKMEEGQAHLSQPSYHELNAVRSPNQQLQNPLLRNAPLGQLPKSNFNSPYAFSPYGAPWSMSPPMALGTPHSCASQQLNGPLPLDLENLTLPDQPLIEMGEMEAVIRHELSQTTNNQLNFDI